MDLRYHFLLAVSAVALAAQTPGGVKVTADIVYAQYGSRKLRLDVYRPPSSKPLPGILVIRGGGWRQGDKNGFAPIARNLAARGFVTACIEYRVLPDVQFPDPVYDTKAAVRWMRAEGQQYGINPDEIGALGGSAGGHLVALLGTSYKNPALEGSGGHPGVSSRVQAVVAMAPVTDFLTMERSKSQGATVVQTFFQGHAELAKSLSPVTYLDADSAPILLLHGDEDKTVPIAQSEEMLERAKKAGVRAQFVTISGAPHAFWNMPKYAPDTIDKAAAFFHEVLGN